jgi:hypothetical protein
MYRITNNNHWQNFNRTAPGREQQPEHDEPEPGPQRPAPSRKEDPDKKKKKKSTYEITY